MRHTFLADMAARERATVSMTYETTDASGETVLSTTELRGTAVTSFLRGLDETTKIARAWRRDRTCCDCRRPIATAKEAGVVEVASLTYVAHRRGGCLARAIAKHHPSVARTIVHPRVAGGAR